MLKNDRNGHLLFLEYWLVWSWYINCENKHEQWFRQEDQNLFTFRAKGKGFYDTEIVG